MTIDGIDIKTYGGKQWNVSMSYCDITNNSLSIAENPFLMTGNTGLKKIKISLIFQGASRQEIWMKASELTAKLLSPAIIKLDGFEHLYNLVLTNAEQAESAIKKFHKTTYEMIGYEFSKEESITTTSKYFTITNDGNLITPATIEITPLIGATSLTITGLSRDAFTKESKNIVINKMTTNKTVTVSETGLITESGANKISDVVIWELPSLLPGTNYIGLDKESMRITIKYKPRYI